MTRYYYQAGVIRVCVDDTSGSRISGRLYSPVLEEPMLFTDIGSLVLQMETLYDTQGFPDAFQRIRCFTPRKEKAPQLTVISGYCQREELVQQLASAREHRGRQATFEIHVTTRQNATWQGWIDWLELGMRQQFKSVLELLRQTDAYLIQGRVPMSKPEARQAIAT